MLGRNPTGTITTGAIGSNSPTLTAAQIIDPITSVGYGELSRLVSGDSVVGAFTSTGTFEHVISGTANDALSAFSSAVTGQLAKPGKVFNRIRVTVTGAPGTGDITLGSPLPGHRSYSDAGAAVSDIVNYVIDDGSTWELGTATFTGTTLAGRIAIESSNNNAKINASSGSVIYCDVFAADLANNAVYTPWSYDPLTLILALG